MTSTTRKAAPVAAGLCVLALASGTAIAGDFEDAVRARWRGAWVVLGTEVYSDCSGGYHTNSINGTLVSSRGGHRFLPGELGRVEKLQLKKKKVDVMVTLDEPLLVSRQDGPFTLYDERHCAVSLEITVERETTRERDVAAIDGLVAGIIERYDTREAATESTGWNAREREPYPDDYDLTLARHAAWRAEQTNLAVDRKRQDALEAAKTSGLSISEDPEYLQGLAAGVEQMRRWSVSDCGQLMARGFDRAKAAVPEEHRGDTDAARSWRRGWDDGQRLVYGLAVWERLERCYVAVPPVPGEALPASDSLTSLAQPATPAAR